MKPDLLKRKTKSILRRALPADARVLVIDGEDEDLYVKVISRSFAGKSIRERGEIIWTVLFDKLTQDEWGRISLTLGQTPSEARRNGAFTI